MVGCELRHTCAPVGLAPMTGEDHRGPGDRAAAEEEALQGVSGKMALVDFRNFRTLRRIRVWLWRATSGMLLAKSRAGLQMNYFLKIWEKLGDAVEDPR